ncbi:MAG: thiamine biosynthesis protein ThiF [Sulfurimonas sp. RIFOXYD12_FULL_33_39]|uniref:thiamine biosynthesis protein ThiF n=1 Tax=unclassified Sulfurimonas TaxID=2623549 RepID=UPI0008CFFE09|nr:MULTISPECIES: thiamine biosynthesis protein ThiF [unclassified Sulfurimonas]OHE10247.1 MAG: thiamine biosynthesis protein ThiF [Sulfurimonas sp. RIFOXYD12_FULL_33_39]OHE14532.1 MAG: thiamine biosynthesis protein ThiF [Sulfurimonas sp. RIFOXYD2_FULL_34_21]DAB27919.1 MAG TPA: thiamine biosynthesis protein ThiF [Sulfurimonas sp. UBA10385]
MFDLDNPLVCEGIIGDGCGGGRLFFIEDETLKAYDPQSKEVINLLSDIKDAKKISKKGCIITIECQKESIKLDLSQIKS